MISVRSSYVELGVSGRSSYEDRFRCFQWLIKTEPYTIIIAIVYIMTIIIYPIQNDVVVCLESPGYVVLK